MLCLLALKIRYITEHIKVIQPVQYLPEYVMHNPTRIATIRSAARAMMWSECFPHWGICAVLPYLPLRLSLAVKVQHINKECGKDRDSRESKVLKGKEGSQRGNPVKQKRKESSLLCLSFTHLLLFSFITPSYHFIQMTIDRIPFSISTAIIVLCHLLGHINQRTMKWVSVFGLLSQRLNTFI